MNVDPSLLQAQAIQVMHFIAHSTPDIVQDSKRNYQSSDPYK